MRILLCVLLLSLVLGCAPNEEAKPKDAQSSPTAPLAPKNGTSQNSTSPNTSKPDTNRTVDQAASNFDPELIGIWKAQGEHETVTIELKGDGTFTATSATVNAHGTFVVNGDMIDMQVIERNGTKPTHEAEAKGQLKISEDKSTLSLMNAGGNSNVELKKQ